MKAKSLKARSLAAPTTTKRRPKPEPEADNSWQALLKAASRAIDENTRRWWSRDGSE
jgi:hypothetical protein